MPGKSLLIVSAVLVLLIAVPSAADEPSATATPSAADPVNTPEDKLVVTVYVPVK